MEPSKALVDALYAERVARARQASPESKMLDSLRLFDYTRRIMIDAIRNENPDADEGRIQEILRQRLALRERLECSA
jgi:hypothetical protein